MEGGNQMKTDILAAAILERIVNMQTMGDYDVLSVVVKELQLRRELLCPHKIVNDLDNNTLVCSECDAHLCKHEGLMSTRKYGKDMNDMVVYCKHCQLKWRKLEKMEDGENVRV